MLFAPPLKSRTIRNYWLFPNWVEKLKWAFTRWLRVHLSRDNFSKLVNQILKSGTNIDFANFLRFPSEIIEKYAFRKYDESFLNRFSLRVWFWKRSYKIEWNWKTYWDWDQIYWDWDNSVFLFFEGKPLVIISFSIYEKDTITIEQIQWIKWDSDCFELQWFDWRKCSVEIIETMGKKLWYKYVWIIPASFSLWFCEYTEKCEEWWEYYNLYDQLAIDMWYINSKAKPIYKKLL